MTLKTENDKFAISFCLYKDKEVAVARIYAETNAIFEKHYHNELEVVTIVSGVLSILLDDGDEIQNVTLTSGQTLHILPNVVHSSVILETCILVVLTIPASEGFPDGE